MNFWRGIILAFWLLLIGGGWAFARYMALQKRHWKDVGAELPALAIQAVFISDLLVRYSYIWFMLVTAVCILMWISVGNDRRREESPE
jgi:hypothetical protein